MPILLIMRHLLRLRPLTCLAAVALAAAALASGSEPLTDPNVAFGSLQVNAKGEALLTYKRSDGRMRHVLVWGALNARPPSDR